MATTPAGPRSPPSSAACGGRRGAAAGGVWWSCCSRPPRDASPAGRGDPQSRSVRRPHPLPTGSGLPGSPTPSRWQRTCPAARRVAGSDHGCGMRANCGAADGSSFARAARRSPSSLRARHEAEVPAGGAAPAALGGGGSARHGTPRPGAHRPPASPVTARPTCSRPREAPHLSGLQG